MDGPNVTSQTSPRRGDGSVVTLRFVCHVGLERGGPGVGFGLARFVGRHRGVSGGEVLADDMRTSKVIQEAADATAADDGVQAAIDFGVRGDGEFLRHPGLQYVLEYDDWPGMQGMVERGWRRCWGVASHSATVQAILVAPQARRPKYDLGATFYYARPEYFGW
jgi:hypothetical protein